MGIKTNVHTFLCFVCNVIIILTFLGVPENVSVRRLIAVSNTLDPVSMEGKLVNEFNITCNIFELFLWNNYPLRDSEFYLFCTGSVLINIFCVIPFYVDL